uniref:Uncharacterized protein n=1 Tax=Anopheles culicifacies TaxID=139723 RepID=A0A182MLA9_9DIPT
MDKANVNGKVNHGHIKKAKESDEQNQMKPMEQGGQVALLNELTSEPLLLTTVSGEREVAPPCANSAQKSTLSDLCAILFISSGSGSVAEEIEAPVFERTGPRFESHSRRSPVRRADYRVAGTFKLRKPEMAGHKTSRGCRAIEEEVNTL